MMLHRIFLDNSLEFALVTKFRCGHKGRLNSGGGGVMSHLFHASINAKRDLHARKSCS